MECHLKLFIGLYAYIVNIRLQSLLTTCYSPCLSKTVKRTAKTTFALECALSTVHILVQLALFIDYIEQNIVKKTK